MFESSVSITPTDINSIQDITVVAPPESKPAIVTAKPPATTNPLKRERSGSSAPAGRSSKKLRGPNAIADVGDAIREASTRIADVLADDVGILATPLRRKEAVRLLENDMSLSIAARTTAFRLFRCHIEIADTFLAIEKLEGRTLYIEDELNNM